MASRSVYSDSIDFGSKMLFIIVMNTTKLVTLSGGDQLPCIAQQRYSYKYSFKCNPIKPSKDTNRGKKIDIRKLFRRIPAREFAITYRTQSHLVHFVKCGSSHTHLHIAPPISDVCLLKYF